MRGDRRGRGLVRLGRAGGTRIGPTQVAGQGGAPEIAEILLTAGAALRPFDDGRTALHAACASGHEAVARALVAAEPSALAARTRSSDQTPLELARANDFGPIARRLEALAGT